MNRKEALYLLTAVGCPVNVINHCSAVSEKARYIAQKVQNDHPVDIHLVEMGGLLHDIGRAVTHSIDHGIVGARLLKKRGINRHLQRICETHILAGVPKAVAKDIGLPPRDFIPQTMEEKIVCHADNMTNHTIEELRIGWKNFFGEKNGQIIITLLDNLYNELKKYTNVP
jgi:uncharacterized protein